MKIIEAENIDFKYDEAEIFKGLSVSVEAGSFLAIAGPNGAGKTTLLNMLCGLLRPMSGVIKIDGKSIKAYNNETLARKVAVVRQEFVPTFGFSVMETVLMARTSHYGTLGFEREADRQIAFEALKATDTADFAQRQLSQISGGERQRVFIARALAQDTPILLLDEPTSFLDLHHQVQIYDLLKKMQAEKGKTIVAITHDVNLAAQYCDQALLMCAGTGYHRGTCREVFSKDRIEEVFGVEGFTGQVGCENFFLPLGKFAKDYRG